MAPISSSRRGRRSCIMRVGVAVAGAVSACATLQGFLVPIGGVFVTGVSRNMVFRSSANVHMNAEGATPAPASTPDSGSAALVKVTEENISTTASIVGGLVGLWFGGLWVGGALFVAASYITRKGDNDVATALKGVSSATLGVINYSGDINDKYKFTNKIGSSLGDALKKNGGGGVLSSIESTVEELRLKDTLGTLATSTSDAASQAVDKVVDFNKEYKIIDQITEKIQSQTSK